VVFPTCLGPVSSRIGKDFEARRICSSIARFIYINVPPIAIAD